MTDDAALPTRTCIVCDRPTSFPVAYVGHDPFTNTSKVICGRHRTRTQRTRGPLSPTMARTFATPSLLEKADHHG